MVATERLEQLPSEAIERRRRTRIGRVMQTVRRKIDLIKLPIEIIPHTADRPENRRVFRIPYQKPQELPMQSIPPQENQTDLSGNKNS